jgi:hypothetical protein
VLITLIAPTSSIQISGTHFTAVRRCHRWADSTNTCIEIRITFEQDLKPSQSLAVLVGSSKKKAIWLSSDSQTHRWTLEPTV